VHAKKIHAEIDPSEINKNVRVDVALPGTCGARWKRWFRPCSRARARAGWSASARFRGEAGRRDVQSMPSGGKLLAPHVLHDLWRLTEGKALVVTDVGQHQMWEAQYYKHDRPRSRSPPAGLGTMGFALPAAMGARFARPNDEIWVVAGDGGFQMTAAELTTCAQEGLKINIAIINNGYLGMVRQWQEFFYNRRYVAPRCAARLRPAGAGARPDRAASHATRGDPGGRGARPRRPRHGGGRVPGRAGRLRLPDGAGQHRPAGHDPPARVRRGDD